MVFDLNHPYYVFLGKGPGQNGEWKFDFLAFNMCKGRIVRFVSG